jgi:hypothetical protein
MRTMADVVVPAAPNRILAKMLERLFATLVNGPSLNCRPHRSRQRIDLHALARLKDVTPEEALSRLLGDQRQAKLTARVPPPPKRLMDVEDEKAQELSEADRAAIGAWRDQEAVLGKLRTIVEDARTYEQDTGVHVLNVGFPLLSLPPSSFGSSARTAGLTRRIVAPIAFVPVAIIVKQGATRSIEIRCAGEGTDRVTPNTALLAWLEQQTGKPAKDLFADEEGEDPWREVLELVRYVGEATGIDTAAWVGSAPRTDAARQQTDESAPRCGPNALSPAPRADEAEAKPAILATAVLGLFPLANQGLLRDMQAMVGGESLSGPVESFIKLSAELEAAEPAPTQPEAAPVERRHRDFATERLIAEADPCQSRAVRLARQCPTLVIHGPPGTGKSQTITNIIGDHLARGERVLVVSDKRTALDVVANRLRHLGLGNLVGLVHDPQRDQRELYRALRQQLDDLAEAASHPQAQRQLEQTDAELQKLHGEITRYAEALTQRDSRGYSFHDLVGEWFGIRPAPGLSVSEPALKQIPIDALDAHTREIQDVLQRAQAIGWPANPWKDCAGIELPAFLARPMAEFRTAVARCVADAQAADATADPAIPAFDIGTPLDVQARARETLAPELEKLLASADPAVLAHWAARNAAAIGAAKAKLDAAVQQMTIFRAGPLDEELMARCDAGVTPASDRAACGTTAYQLPSRDQSAAHWRVFRDYVQAYRDWSARLAAVRSAAPQAGLGAITHWLARSPQSQRHGQQLIAAMKELADAIAAQPLDREMTRQFARQPIATEQINSWLAALGEYLRIAGKWYAFFKPGAKAAVKPAAQFFGLAVDPAAAQRMHGFLTGMRARLNLRADLEENFLPAPFTSMPADDELLRACGEHAAVAQALSAAPVENGAADVPLEAVHSLMQAQTDGAAPIVKAWGMELTPANADRLATFMGRLNARRQLIELHHAVLAEDAGQHAAQWLDDPALDRSLASHAAMFDFSLKAGADPGLVGLGPAIVAALRDPTQRQTLIHGLRRSPARAAAILKLADSLKSAALFLPAWLAAADKQLRQGDLLHPLIADLADHLPDLESVLRIRVELAALPPQLREATDALVKQSAEPEAGQNILRKAILGAEVVRRLAADPNLQGVDGQRLRSSFEHYRTLESQKKEYVRRTILHRWLTVQKTRLLANTGSRLNALGADLKRRLTLRGERAMRLRQVIQVGAQAEGGDPLFDLCPVWMASPETVAQIFPRQPLFEVVIFDEASQCRLEEALPVLTRGKRIVIAGDPRQLPPTRFFESAIAQSEEEEIETEQQLFESQQREIEDLLAAALNLAVQECYLDVHYRSRNADLIEFSNRQFYHARLQPIPAHPKDRCPCPPLRLYLADGVYERRRNVKEAEQVVAIVRELLAGPDAPSIGIACFNLPQRDLIVEKLDDAAEEDAAFAKRLEAARRREGAGSFEGLFVKNLENVQGDERDHLIISTTYGPDAAGRFYRRFGPVGMAGGGRRLNVLVTRARQRVHIVTSIPQQVYRALPPVPAGQTPGGAYLLFAYLKYAEDLAKVYEQAPPLKEGTGQISPHAQVLPSLTPSRFAESLANRLAIEHRVGSEVHWGNEGFCIDVALHDPVRPQEVTLGVLCDTTRFAQAEDPVEWDVFRATMLEAQGWTLHRVWTPHFYRDAEGGVEAIVRAGSVSARSMSSQGDATGR